MGVDQRGHSANFDQTKPSNDVFGAIVHEQGHDIAFAHALLACPTGILIGQIIQLGICHRLISVIYRHKAWGLLRPDFYTICGVERGLRRKGLNPAKRSKRGQQENQVALQLFKKPHIYCP